MEILRISLFLFGFFHYTTPFDKMQTYVRECVLNDVVFDKIRKKYEYRVKEWMNRGAVWYNVEDMWGRKG